MNKCKMNKKKQKSSYNPPVVKSVSFTIERGYADSPLQLGKYSDDTDLIKPGTHQLEEQQSWAGSVL